MTWAEWAKHLADGAEKARQAGDTAASLALAAKAAGCAQIARNLSELAASQEPLGEDFERVLDEHAMELYER